MELIAKDRQNASLDFIIRGDVSHCVNIAFTYDPENPSFQPLQNLIVCPRNLTALGDLPHTERLKMDKRTEEGLQTNPLSMLLPRAQVSLALQKYNYLLGSRRPQGQGTGAPAPLLLNVTLDIVSVSVGKTILGIEADSPVVDVSDAFVRVSVVHNVALHVASDVVGWISTIAWIFCFFPQAFLNWRRKSVEGLSLDNVTLNICAYIYYTLFNVALYAIPFIKEQFQERFPRSVNQVRLNDVVFPSLGLCVLLLVGGQCVVYQRGPKQAVSTKCRALIVASVSIVAVGCLLVSQGLIWWLDVFYLMSYLKLIITPIKYIPQVYVNYQRKSTTGFSTLMIALDFTGSTMSLTQMFLLSANSDDWISIFTNFTKFGLGLTGTFFSLVFFTQHYHYSLR